MKNKHSFVEFYTTHVLLNKIKHKVYSFLAQMPIIYSTSKHTGRMM